MSVMYETKVDFNIDPDKPKSQYNIIEFAGILPHHLRKRTPITIVPRVIYKKFSKKNCFQCLVKTLCIHDIDKKYQYIAVVNPCKELENMCHELTSVNFTD